MFWNYPHSDYHELNLDWVIAQIKRLTGEVHDFKVINKITWGGLHNPGKEYPMWCIVDTPDHEGYISIKPVPAGITIDNEDYWRQVANYSALYADFQNRIIALETWKDNFKIINVRDYGALGDGVTDDSAVINDIIANAPDYAYIIFPEGEYVANLKVHRSNITLDGLGSKIINPGVDNVIEVGYVDFADNPDHQIRFSDVTVMNFKIDGTYDAGKTYSGDLVGHGVIITAVSNSVFKNLHIENCAATGIDNVIESNYNEIAANVYDCGKAEILGAHYPNADVNSSQYGIYDIFSKGGYHGFRLLDNCRENLCRVAIDNPSINGVIIMTQPNVNDCSNNIVDASIQGGCSSRSIAIASSKTKNNTVRATVKNVSSDFVASIAEGANNTLEMNAIDVTKCLLNLHNTGGNTIKLNGRNIGTSYTIGDGMADIYVEGSISNKIVYNKTDESATPRTRLIDSDVSSNGNEYDLVSDIAYIVDVRTTYNTVKYTYQTMSDVLWTNPNPSTAMSSGATASVTIPYGVKYVAITYKRVYDNSDDKNTIIMKLDADARASMDYILLLVGNPPLISHRTVSYNNGVFTFGGGFDDYDGLTSVKSSDIMCIPVEITAIR